jgi:hypothetical protein
MGAVLLKATLLFQGAVRAALQDKGQVQQKRTQH